MQYFRYNASWSVYVKCRRRIVSLLVVPLAVVGVVSFHVSLTHGIWRAFRHLILHLTALTTLTTRCDSFYPMCTYTKTVRTILRLVQRPICPSTASSRCSIPLTATKSATPFDQQLGQIW